MTNCCRKKNDFGPERLTADTKQLGIALGQSISVRTVCTFCGLKARHVRAWGEAHGAKPQVMSPNIASPPCEGGTLVGKRCSGPSGLANETTACFPGLRSRCSLQPGLSHCGLSARPRAGDLQQLRQSNGFRENPCVRALRSGCGSESGAPDRHLGSHPRLHLAGANRLS